MTGYIFRCTAKTKPEVYERMLLGEEPGLWGHVSKIQSDDILFLYNTSTFEITGPLKPDGEPGNPVEKGAWKGGFTSQIKFAETEDTKTIPFAKIQHIIKKYRHGLYPEMVLDARQVEAILEILSN
ncbi:MAG: Development and cell death domain protein [candidate division WS6 bacterium OLB20]|uniref:Development and cell death domain protein n=1 Tax=candidate division WS6 bacterium OLB20 TaxID=1617426 RepID=A0A136M118_9BACT|nr:MAG: Development and cell death domain protein [candidate division WS6 bacterium OLB20]